MQNSVNKSIVQIGPNIVTFEEVINHLQIPELNAGDSDEIASNSILINNMIQAAQIYLNDYLGEFVSDTLVSANYKDLSTDFVLDYNYIKSVKNIKYFDETNTEQILNNTYVLDNTTNPTIVRVDRSAPINVTLSDTLEYPVTVEYTVGVPSKDTGAYDNVKMAVMLIVGEMYNNRTGMITQRVREGKYTFSALKLVNAYRRRII